MFAGRATFDRTDSLIKFLVDSGITASTLEAACNNIHYIHNFPRALIRKEAISRYFKFYGRDTPAQRALMTKTPMRSTVGTGVSSMNAAVVSAEENAKKNAKRPGGVNGAILQIDAFDPPFQHMWMKNTNNEEAAYGSSSHKKRVNSIEGYVDFIVASCMTSGFFLIFGRKDKTDMHRTVVKILAKWISLFGEGTLTEVRAAVDILSADTVEYIELLHTNTGKCVSAVKAPSGGKEHDHFTGHIEVTGRWIVVEAQANWNRLLALIESEVITELRARKLWFDAVVHARDMMLLRPAFNDPTKTRYEAGYRQPPDIARQIVMPFGTLVIGNLIVANNLNGPGCVAIYLHALHNSPTSISAYNCDTHHTAVLYSFKPVVKIPELSQEALDRIREDLILREVSEDSHPVSEEADRPTDLQAELESGVENGETKNANVTGRRMQLRSSDRDQLAQWVYTVIVHGSECDGTIAPHAVSHTRSSVSVIATNLRFDVDAAEGSNNCIYQLIDQLADAGRGEVVPSDDEGVRPPKPTIPSRSVCNSDERWIRSDKREIESIAVYKAQVALETDEQGRFIFPNKCIIYRVNVVHDYKWRLDPFENLIRWLECSRFTADSSRDSRTLDPGQVYAATPDIGLVLFFMGIIAVLRMYVFETDAVRAYLQAPSIDEDEIILMYDENLQRLGMPKYARIVSGFYGTLMAALGFDQFSDSVFKIEGWRKLDVARCMYIKYNERHSCYVYALHHSDNYTYACINKEAVYDEYAAVSKHMKLTPLAPVSNYLGMEWKRVNMMDGAECELGNVWLVRQRVNIEKMVAQHKHRADILNPRHRVRTQAFPSNGDDRKDIPVEKTVQCKDNQNVDYQKLTGSLNFIMRTRPSLKYEMRELAAHNHSPRVWDWERAIWFMEYLEHTKDMPLVLGGDKFEPQSVYDGALGTMDEHRSLYGGYTSIGPGAGAHDSCVKTLKCAITQIMEVEVYGLAAGCDANLYCRELANEMHIPIPRGLKVYCDNKAAMDWSQDITSMKGTRHFAKKLYRVKHLRKDGEISPMPIEGIVNAADKCTKVTVGEDFLFKTGTIQGHALVQGLNIPGVIEIVVPVKKKNRKEVSGDEVA